MARSTVFKVVIGTGAAVLLVVVIGVVTLVYNAPSACGCAIPPDDEDALETAQQYVAGVAEDPEAMLAEEATAPDADRVAELTGFDAPDTEWTVMVTERPDGGYGRSPGERLVVGMTPEGEVTALVVHTETDYKVGTVDPQVEIESTEPVIARSGEFPIFGELNVAVPGGARYQFALFSLTEGRLPLTVTDRGGAWVYVGAEPLQEEEYRYLRGGHRSDGTWWLRTAWFSPSDPVTEDD
ncbi:MAG TPA: hypothetical protein VK060_09675 [Ruania sp.]|nr:hypothetical protein [Ruania sp.]